MKRIITLLLIAGVTLGCLAQRQDLTPRLDMEGVLKKDFELYKKGSLILFMNVIKLTNQRNYNDGIYLAVAIENTQVPIPSYRASKLIELYPKTMEQFWMAEYINQNMFEHYDNKGYNNSLRNELVEEAEDYLESISDLVYEDAYLEDYIRTIFTGLVPKKFNRKRTESPDVKLIQSPEPYAKMLANGTLVLSTGLLSTIDSVEELTGIIVSEIAHYVLDHPVINTAKEISRVKRAEFWGGLLVAAAGVTEAVISENNENYIPGGILLTAATADMAINSSAINRLGMGYNDKQVRKADRIATDFLKFAKMDPAALSSAMNKIDGYFKNNYGNKYRSETFGNLNERISDLKQEPKEMKNRAFQRTVSGLNTLNAIMQLNSRNYIAAKDLAIKNIENKLATDDDYVIVIKANMQLENSPEANEKNLELVQVAKKNSPIPNLELYKQEILLLMRMDKQMKVSDVLVEYMTLLTDFKKENSGTDDANWAQEEIKWADKLYKQIGLF